MLLIIYKTKIHIVGKEILQCSQIKVDPDFIIINQSNLTWWKRVREEEKKVLLTT